MASVLTGNPNLNHEEARQKKKTTFRESPSQNHHDHPDHVSAMVVETAVMEATKRGAERTIFVNPMNTRYQIPGMPSSGIPGTK